MADSNTVHVGGPVVESTEARFVKVEGRITTLQQGFDQLSSTVVQGFEKITTKLEAKTSPPWHLIALAMPVLTGAIGAVWILFSVYSSHVERAIDEQKLASGRFMARDDIVALNNAGKEIADLKMQIVGKDVARLGEDVKDLQSKLVPLSTHEQLWKAQADTNRTLLGAIDENRKSLADITAPKDTISRFDRRLEELERARRTGRAD